MSPASESNPNANQWLQHAESDILSPENRTDTTKATTPLFSITLYY
jgi:hypothetical protein